MDVYSQDHSSAERLDRGCPLICASDAKMANVCPEALPCAWTGTRNLVAVAGDFTSANQRV